MTFSSAYSPDIDQLNKNKKKEEKKKPNLSNYMKAKNSGYFTSNLNIFKNNAI